MALTAEAAFKCTKENRVRRRPCNCIIKTRLSKWKAQHFVIYLLLKSYRRLLCSVLQALQILIGHQCQVLRRYLMWFNLFTFFQTQKPLATQWENHFFCECFLIQRKNSSQGWLSWVSNLSLLSVWVWGRRGGGLLGGECSFKFTEKQSLRIADYLPCGVSMGRGGGGIFFWRDRHGVGLG